MTDIAPALYEKLHKDFDARTDANGRLAKLKVKANPTYKDAQDFSEIVGNALQRSFKLIKSDDLPGGVMYYNIADRTVRPLLIEAYEKVAGYTEHVQASKNAKAGLKLKAVVPELNESRINGIIDILTEDVFSETSWILSEPVTNYCLSTVMDSIQANAELQNKAGVKAYIVRSAESNCCQWCEDLEGVYEYPVNNPDVYMRHENCRCVVDFFNEEEGYKQDVWSKAKEPADTRQEMLGRYEQIINNQRQRANSRGQ